MSTPTPPDPIVLVTDIDGTLVHRTAAGTVRLLQQLQRHRVHVIWATGRNLSELRLMLADPTIPAPEYIIADVGATVVDGRTLLPVRGVQEAIAAKWIGHDVVLEALRPFPGIRPQARPQEYRCSFYAEPAAVTGALRSAIEGLGCELVYSDGRYLDVLPRGVSKGSTTARLLEQLGWSHARVMVAGDSENDVSLLCGPWLGVVPSNADPRLAAAARKRRRVHLSPLPGPDGVLDGLRHHGLVGDGDAPQAAGSAQVVLGYHRSLRVDSARAPAESRVVNGVVTSMSGFTNGEHECVWVGCSLSDSSSRTTSAPTKVDFSGHRITGVPVQVNHEDLRLFYDEICRSVIWLAVHGFVESHACSPEAWNRYSEINRRFAETIAKQVASRGTAIIQDYSLWLVPGFLRRLRPDVRIGFFHHTPFPSPDVLCSLPWRREILASLVNADFVGFQTSNDVNNFAQAVVGATPCEITEYSHYAPRFRVFDCSGALETVPAALRVHGKEVRMRAIPVGVDRSRIVEALARPGASEKIAAHRDVLQGRVHLVSVSRLDLTKGTLEQLSAFADFLDRYPAWRERVLLTAVVSPNGSDTPKYSRLREHYGEAVQQLQERYRDLRLSPIRVWPHALGAEDLAPLLASADVAVVTPLRDGLNLVAKEYVVARQAVGRTGSVVLSEQAGVAAELFGAVLVNPHDIRGTADALARVLAMNDSERSRRFTRMTEVVCSYSVTDWAQSLLQETRGEVPLEGSELTAPAASQRNVVYASDELKQRTPLRSGAIL
jgi:HAD superfamily hydrolase (TIGR01484 family)